MSNNVICKILTTAQWNAFRDQGVFRGSPVDLADGYIHFSTEAQLPGTLAKHYAGAGELRVLRVDPSTLGDALQWEVSRDDQLFPHLYAELSLSSVIDVETVIQNASND